VCAPRPRSGRRGYTYNKALNAQRAFLVLSYPQFSDCFGRRRQSAPGRRRRTPVGLIRGISTVVVPVDRPRLRHGDWTRDQWNRRRVGRPRRRGTEAKSRQWGTMYTPVGRSISKNVMCLIVAGFVIASALVVGCHSSSNNSGGGTSTPSTYSGTLTGTGGASGTVDFTITPPAAAVMPAIGVGTTTDNATGTLTLTGSSPVSLTGTFTSPSGPLVVSGGGYQFNGTVSGSTLSGTWTGPGATGSFTTINSTGGSSVTVYCGTYSGTNTGTWNLAVSGSTVSGSFSDTNGNSGTLSGTVSGSTVTLTISTGGTATGTINGTSVSGTWSAGNNSGTWSGSSTGC